MCTWYLCPLSLGDHQSIEGALPTARLLYMSECALIPSHYVPARPPSVGGKPPEIFLHISPRAIPPEKVSQRVRAQEIVKHTKLLPLHLMYTAVFPKLLKMLDPCHRSSRRE
ncbi:hypothetical protein GJ744_000193 [Endocarpon pusillum]|uniref:Uncharacterized protein n=1 Tax=Endocarpon pusillum TaxID=364733 RepID=A0A8H7EAM3_9EURO|nr:hypothetical protein GJ744_000193 [Endocarpon pusillum]